MNPEKTFNLFLLRALSRTRPDGSQSIKDLRTSLQGLGEAMGGTTNIDSAGNLWVDMRDNGSKTLFTAHMDTVGRFDGPTGLITGEVWHTDGQQVLGADDGAGIAILAGLMANGTKAMYLFTQGEECGGIGAKHAAKTYSRLLSEFDRAIAFDRKGTREICGSQCVGTLASENFVYALSDSLGLGHDWGDGLYTDNAEFQGLIPEIVNISCGYETNHSKLETLDYVYLAKLLNACLAVDWEALPTEGPTERHSNISAFDSYLAYDSYGEHDLDWILYEAAQALGLPWEGDQIDLLKDALRQAYDVGVDSRQSSLIYRR